MKKDILQRLAEGPVLGDGGYLLELEKRGWVQAGPFTPEVSVGHPEAVAELKGVENAIRPIISRLVAAERERFAGYQQRYGFTLDTRRAEHDLGFRPSSRIGLARAGDGSLRLETASV